MYNHQKGDKSQKDVDKLKDSRQSHAQEKAEFLCRISVLEDNTEAISKLSKKGTTTFITLAEKVQEALKKASQSK